MIPVSRIQFFRGNQLQTATAVDEPCLVLVRNDTVLNLLMAERALPQGDGLQLTDVTWFCAHRDRTTSRALPVVDIERNPDGIWLARERETRKLIRRPSRIPYHALFIDMIEHRRLCRTLAQGDGAAVFLATQQRFGQLPGFDFGDGVLISPPGYATVDDLPDQDVLPE